MQTLYYGGTICTMDAAMPYAQALVIDGNRIAAVGNTDALCQLAPQARQIFLDGAVVLPGFIDAHSHFSQVAAGFLQVSVAQAESLDDLTGTISKFITNTTPAADEWVLARDFDPSHTPRPTLATLDALSGGRPLVVQYKSGHMGLFNTAALQALQLRTNTPVPDGGSMEIRNGKLTGYLEENAYFAAMRRIPPVSPEKMCDAYTQAQAQYAGYGITAVQEGMFLDQMLPMYAQLVEKKLLQLDLIVYPELDSLEQTRLAFSGSLQDPHIKLGGIKIFLDGSPQGRTAWMRTPYQGRPKTCGYGTLPDETVMDAMRLAATRQMQLLAHCNGDAACEQMLRCLAATAYQYPQLRRLRPVLIHAQLLGLDQIARARDLGAIASFFGAHVFHWGDVHIENFGLQRACQISPAGSALQAGLPFTFHQDAPVIAPNMLETIGCAVSRRTKAGIRLGPQEEISVWQALHAVTVSAAYQYFEETEKGTLRAGKRADLVILSADPLQTPPDQIPAIRVLQTIKDGTPVFTA